MTKALMTIHGFLTDTKDFGRLYQYVDFYDEVVPYEVPGHNGEVDFSLFSAEKTVQGLLSTFDELAARHSEVDIAGFSMGGALTTYLCSYRRVGKAVLLAPSNKYINWVSPLSAIKFYIRFAADMVKKKQFQTDEVKRYLENSALSAQIAYKRILPNINMHTFTVFKELMELSNGAMVDASPIAVPTLMLWGELDELVPRASIELVQKHFCNVQTQIIPDIGHAMLYTNKDNVLINEIVRFLSDGECDPDVPFVNKLPSKRTHKKI